MANVCPVLLMLLSFRSVNDEVSLHDAAPAAQGRMSYRKWEKPMIERGGRPSVLHFPPVMNPTVVVGFSERFGSAIQGGAAGG